MLKIVVNCGRCEAFIGRCLDSLKRQSYPHWQAFVTVDRRGDATYERAIAARDGDARIHVTQNERRLYAYILTLLPHRADADDVLQEASLVMWDKFDDRQPPASRPASPASATTG